MKCTNEVKISGKNKCVHKLLLTNRHTNLCNQKFQSLIKQSQ